MYLFNGQHYEIPDLNRGQYKCFTDHEYFRNCGYFTPFGKLVTIRTTSFNINTFYVLPTQCIFCVLYGSENKQRLFLYTALTDCFL